MPAIVGGTRARLVRESLYNMLYDALEDLGWLDLVGRDHATIHFTGRVVDRLTEIPVNTAVLSDEGRNDIGWELGSNMTESSWTYFFDFYAEDDALGKDLINDVRDILGGRMSSLGRNDPSFLVYDYRQATPPAIFRCQLEDIVVDRAHDFPHPWLRNWYACRFDVIDAYGDQVLYSEAVFPEEGEDEIDGGTP